MRMTPVKDMMKITNPAVTPASRWDQKMILRSVFTNQNPPMRSYLGAAPQKVVIAIGQLDDGGVVGQQLIHFVDRHVEIEKERARAVVAHHALHPEKRSEAHAACHRIDVVQA